MFIVYVWSFCWLCILSKTMTLLNNINENNSINEVMNKLFHEKPEVKINCNCYHYERVKTTTTDLQGRQITSYQLIAVNTYNETRELDIFSYIDISGIFRLKQTKKNLIELEMGKEINFNDEITLIDIQNIKNDLYLKNRNKDSCISITVDRIIPGMENYYLIKLNKDKKYFLLKKWIYILSVFLMIDQFYRLYLDCICSKQFFIIRKIISSRNNVLENNKYSQFTPGFSISDNNVVEIKNDISGVNKDMNLSLPTEEELINANNYRKYIPEYKFNENGEVININNNSVDNILNIKEENNNKPIIEKNQNKDNFVSMNILNQDNKKEELINSN